MINQVMWNPELSFKCYRFTKELRVRNLTRPRPFELSRIRYCTVLQELVQTPRTNKGSNRCIVVKMAETVAKRCKYEQSSDINSDFKEFSSNADFIKLVGDKLDKFQTVDFSFRMLKIEKCNANRGICFFASTLSNSHKRKN
jgi:hypothetical protein